jgi:membrane protein
MRGLWSLGGLSWSELLRRTARESWEDEVFGQAARLAFYHFLALFPTLLLALLILTRLSTAGSEFLKTLQSSLSTILPPSASGLVARAIEEIGKRSAHGSLWFASLGAVWAALNGTWAVMSGLNDAYEVEENRPWWRVTLTAAGLTIALAALGFAALALLLYGGRLGQYALARLGWPDRTTDAWQIVHWPVLLVLLLFAFALYYRFGPNLPDAEWRWATPGAALAAVLWITATVLFHAYVDLSPGKYERIYGPVAAAALLLLWFYVTGAAILIGGEMNSEIENAVAQHGHPDARRPGDHRPGGRPAARQWRRS